FTADPNIVPDARKLARVSYDEMLELASLGAKVLQSRSVEFAKKYGVTVHVRSTFRPDPGTLVTKEELGMEQAVVTGVTHDRSQAKISLLRVPDRPGIASKMFAALAREGINIQMISTSEIAISCVIEDKYAELAVRALHDAFEVGAGIAH